MEDILWDLEQCPLIVERSFILGPFLGGSTIGGFTVIINDKLLVLLLLIRVTVQGKAIKQVTVNTTLIYLSCCNLQKEDNLFIKDKTSEFILSPTCPFIGGFTVIKYIIKCMVESKV